MSNLTMMVDRLKQLGLSDDEAKAYLTLVIAANPMDSQEIGRDSGVPAASIEETMAALVARGAVLRSVTPAAEFRERYTPVPPEALLSRLSRDFESSLAQLRDELPRLRVIRQTYMSQNLDTRSAVLERAAVLIRAARRGIWAAIWPGEMPDLAPLLDEARGAEVDVTVLLGGERSNITGATFWHRNAPHDSVLAHLGYRLLVLIADNNQAVIAGFQGSHTWGVFTDNPAVVLLAVEYVRNNIGSPLTEPTVVQPDDFGSRR